MILGNMFVVVFGKTLVGTYFYGDNSVSKTRDKHNSKQNIIQKISLAFLANFLRYLLRQQTASTTSGKKFRLLATNARVRIFHLLTWVGNKRTKRKNFKGLKKITKSFEGNHLAKLFYIIFFFAN